MDDKFCRITDDKLGACSSGADSVYRKSSGFCRFFVLDVIHFFVSFPHEGKTI